MSRKGNCYDNAPMESFWGVLKNEQIHHCRYARLYETLQGTSRFSITGKEGRPDSDSCLPLLMNDCSMKNDWQHERFGVHY